MNKSRTTININPDGTIDIDTQKAIRAMARIAAQQYEETSKIREEIEEEAIKMINGRIEYHGRYYKTFSIYEINTAIEFLVMRKEIELLKDKITISEKE